MSRTTQTGKIAISDQENRHRRRKRTDGERWSPEMDASLLRLLQEGLSSSQIAKVIGVISRNAVIGRLHRLKKLGVSVPSSAYRPPLAAMKARKAAGGRSTKPGGETAAAVSALLKSEKLVRTATTLAIRQAKRLQEIRQMPSLEQTLDKIFIADRPDAVPFLNLRAGLCKFPLWPDVKHTPLDRKIVCGAVTAIGSPWCDACLDIVVIRNPTAKTKTPSRLSSGAA